MIGKLVILISAALLYSSKSYGKEENKKQLSKDPAEFNEENQKLKTDRHKLQSKVIVVGAGIAGLSAARKIANSGYTFSVNVYEAKKDRYGGRVWTDKLRNIKAKGHFQKLFNLL